MMIAMKRVQGRSAIFGRHFVTLLLSGLVFESPSEEAGGPENPDPFGAQHAHAPGAGKKSGFGEAYPVGSWNAGLPTLGEICFLFVPKP